MKSQTAVRRLSALAQETRLAIFRLLVERGPDGLCAGDIQARLRLAPATLSFHLKALTGAALLKPRQDGRFIHYAVDFAVMQTLLDYLTDHCCGGEPCEVACAPTGIRRKAA